MEYTRTSRLPSVVSPVGVQLTVTVKGESDPPRAGRLCGETGHVGSVLQLSVLPGSRTLCAPHSSPVRAAWYARTPRTSSWLADCCSPVTEAMKTASSVSTTRRKIAVTTLNPLWRLRGIVDVHLLIQPDGFVIPRDRDVEHDHAGACRAGVIRESAGRHLAR